MTCPTKSQSHHYSAVSLLKKMTLTVRYVNSLSSACVRVQPREYSQLTGINFCLLQTIELRPARVLLLGPLEEERTGNNSGRALFLFRNLVNLVTSPWMNIFNCTMNIVILADAVCQVQDWKLQLHHFL